jgi:hypothetical protein
VIFKRIVGADLAGHAAAANRNKVLLAEASRTERDLVVGELFPSHR